MKLSFVIFIMAVMFGMVHFAAETSAAPQGSAAEEQGLENEAAARSNEVELEDGAAGAEERMSGAEFPESAEEESRRRKRQTPGEPQGIVGARLVVGGARKIFKPRERE